MRPNGAGQLEPLLGVGRHGDPIAGLREVALDHLADRLAVVDDKNQGLIHRSPLRLIWISSSLDPGRKGSTVRPSSWGSTGLERRACAPSSSTRSGSPDHTGYWPRSRGSSRAWGNA